MTSKEIVQSTLERSGPERVARCFADSDFVFVRCETRTHATDWRRTGDSAWERSDQWGNIWHRIDPTSKGEVARGILDDLAAADTYEFPDFDRAEDYAVVAAQRARHPDKWLIGSVPGFAFNIARKMRKLDSYLMDLLLEPQRIRALHDRIDQVVAAMIRQYAASGVDCVMFSEDWGTQSQTLISPVLWREEFFPRFRKLCRLAHDLGIRVFMHSCGRIEAIVPGLIEAGMDLLQFDQPEVHGIDALASYQRSSKIAFWCPVDIQTVLQTRDEKIIRRKAREMLDKLWRGEGGFVADVYGDNESIGLDPRWQEIACDEFLRHGVAATYHKDPDRQSRNSG